MEAVVLWVRHRYTNIYTHKPAASFRLLEVECDGLKLLKDVTESQWNN